MIFQELKGVPASHLSCFCCRCPVPFTRFPASTFLNFVSLSIVAVPFGRIFPLFFPVVGPAFIEISSRLNDQCDIVGLKRSFHLVALVVARRKHHVITRLVILSFLGVVGAVVNSWTGNYIG
jgi:hypothetical protein